MHFEIKTYLDHENNEVEQIIADPKQTDHIVMEKPLKFMENLVPGRDFTFFAITYLILPTPIGMPMLQKVRVPIKNVTTVSEAFDKLSDVYKDFQTQLEKEMQKAQSQSRLTIAQPGDENKFNGIQI